MATRGIDLPGPLVLDIDPFDEPWLADPYRNFAMLRDAGAVFYIPRYECYGMARHAQVHGTLKDWQTFVSARGVGLDRITDPAAHWREPSLLLETDPPLHDEMRAIVSRVLNAAALKALRPNWRAVAERLVDGLVGVGSFDAVPRIAEAFPTTVFGDAMGIVPEERHNLIRLGMLAFEAVGPRTTRVARTFEMAPEVLAWSDRACRRESLAPQGFGAQIHGAVDDGKITVRQAELLVRSLLSAGVDTTVSGIGAALHAFAANPDQWAQLRERPALLKTALDEVLRWDSVVQCFFRTTSRPVAIEGVKLPQHAKVMLFFAAANRDPARWGEPDLFDINRRDPGHVGFGAGIHACVGQMVARLEIEVLFEALLDRVGTLKLAGGSSRRLNSSIYPFSKLPLELTAR